MVQLTAIKKGKDIIIPIREFEHLLSCLDNQKFINEINADGLKCDYKSIQKENQKAIDDFNYQCRKLQTM